MDRHLVSFRAKETRQHHATAAAKSRNEAQNEARNEIIVPQPTPTPTPTHHKNKTKDKDKKRCNQQQRQRSKKRKRKNSFYYLPLLVFVFFFDLDLDYYFGNNNNNNDNNSNNIFIDTSNILFRISMGTIRWNRFRVRSNSRRRRVDSRYSSSSSSSSSSSWCWCCADAMRLGLGLPSKNVSPFGITAATTTTTTIMTSRNNLLQRGRSASTLSASLSTFLSPRTHDRRCPVTAPSFGLPLPLPLFLSLSRPLSFSLHKDGVGHPNDEEDPETKLSQKQQQFQQRHQHQHQELSKLAKSVRDRVVTLVRSTSRTTDTRCGILVPVVVAVSGGCDSVALFHALVEWMDHLQLQLQLQRHQEHENEINQHQEPHDPSLLLDVTIVHFHHRQRPIDADEDCKLVRELVESYNKEHATTTDNSNSSGNNSYNNTMAFRLEDWSDRIDKDNDNDSSESSSPSSASFSQDKARMWRRTRLKECAQERVCTLRGEHNNPSIPKEGDADNKNSEDVAAQLQSQSDAIIPFGIVLTAHHDDDSYETVLIKLLRGVHLLNLHDRATIASIASMVDGDDHDDHDNNRSNDNSHDECTKNQQIRSTEEDTNKTEETAPPQIYLVRPFVTDATNTGYQPDHKRGDRLLQGHTKEDLVGYLTNRNLPWREDVSNHDPNSKYLRNRVRNELIPLLRDLTEDSFRTKRIPALLEQSRELSNDLQPRVEEYLSSAVVDDEEELDSFFAILPQSGNDTSSRLVWSQALYEWMSKRVQQEHRVATVPADGAGSDVAGVSDDGAAAAAAAASRAFGISYERLQRVVQQLEEYPRRRQWTLELGSEWNVERVGDVLRMRRGDSDATTVVGVGGSNNNNDKDNSSNNSNRNTEQVWEWTLVVLNDDEASIPQDTDENTNCHQFQIQVPADLFEELLSNTNNSLEQQLELVSTTLREAEASAANHKNEEDDDDDDDSKNGAAVPQWLRFVPPWKKLPDHNTNTSSQSVKLRAFLRGQKVPVHLRDTTPLLFLESEGDSTPRRRRRHLVAVCVRGNWIVSKEFHVDVDVDVDVDAENEYDTGSGNQGSGSDVVAAETGNRVILNLTRTR